MSLSSRLVKLGEYATWHWILFRRRSRAEGNAHRVVKFVASARTLSKPHHDLAVDNDRPVVAQLQRQHFLDRLGRKVTAGIASAHEGEESSRDRDRCCCLQYPSNHCLSSRRLVTASTARGRLPRGERGGASGTRLRGDPAAGRGAAEAGRKEGEVRWVAEPQAARCGRAEYGRPGRPLLADMGRFQNGRFGEIGWLERTFTPAMFNDLSFFRAV